MIVSALCLKTDKQRADGAVGLLIYETLESNAQARTRGRCFSFLSILLSIHSSYNFVLNFAFKSLAQGGIRFPLLTNQQTNSMDLSPSGVTSLLNCSRMSRNIV
jgi:hypothetical protein